MKSIRVAQQPLSGNVHSRGLGHGMPRKAQHNYRPISARGALRFQASRFDWERHVERARKSRRGGLRSERIHNSGEAGLELVWSG